MNKPLYKYSNRKIDIIFNQKLRRYFWKKDSNKYPKFVSKKTKPKWFDEECFRKKQEFKKARNKFVKNKTDENRTAFTKSRTIYNKVRQRAKIRHKISEGQRLGNIAKTQPKKFWKSLKKSINKSKHINNDIKIEDLYNHFNNLLGQNRR